MNKGGECFEGGGFSGFFITKNGVTVINVYDRRLLTPICKTKNHVK